MISNCGHDERGKYSGGKAGDQTGTEWQVINWYNRPWKCVLRHPDAATRKLIAQMAKAAAVNNMVGYCKSHRGTFWTNLADSNFDPAQITVPCEADCSSGVAAIVKGAGYRLKNEKLKNVSTACYTGNLRAALKAAGFEVLTDKKYLTSDAYLLEGDILLNDGAHVATNLTNGAKASGGGASQTVPINSNVKLETAKGFNKSLAGTSTDDENGGTGGNTPVEPENGQNGANSEQENGQQTSGDGDDAEGQETSGDDERKTEEQVSDSDTIYPEKTTRAIVDCDGALNLRRSASWGNESICGRAVRGQSYYIKAIHTVEEKKMLETIDGIFLSGQPEHVRIIEV